MKRILLASVAMAAALFATAPPARADAVNNITIAVIPDPDVVPQSLSAPCVICATNQAHNPAGFGFNDFDSQGNDSSFNLFSSNITGAFGNGDDVTVTPYGTGQLRTFLNLTNIDPLFHFSVAIDINTTHAASEHLDFFQLIDLDAAAGSRIIFDIRNVDLPGVHNGNGAADYLLSGFDIGAGCRSSGQFVAADCTIQSGDRLLFRAAWSGAVDGGESFYIVRDPTSADVPEPGSLAIMGSALIGMAGIVGVKRRRRNDGTDVSAA